MDFLNSIIIDLALFFKGHIHFISMSVITTLLMVYGHEINKLFRTLTKSLNSVIRFLLFMTLCSIGYAFIATNIARLIRVHLVTLPNTTFLLGLLVLFVTLGYLAKRNGEI